MKDEPDAIIIVKYLIKNGADADDKSKNGLTPLLKVVSVWESDIDIDLMKYLIEKGANVNVKTPNGATLLHELTGSANEYYNEAYGISFHGVGNRLDAMKYLIEEKKLDVNAKTKDGWTPLYGAVCMSLDVVKYLIEKGADANVKTKDGCTPLHASYISIDTMKYLIEKKGLDVNAYSKRTNSALRYSGTPLHVAVTDGNNIEKIEYLIERGANVDATDAMKRTPRDIARDKGSDTICAILDEAKLPPAERAVARERAKYASENREYDPDRMKALGEQWRREAQQRRDDNQRRMDILEGKPGTTRIVPY